VHDSGRNTGTTYNRDKLFRDFVRQHNLRHADNPSHTYTSEDGTARSTIDHFLASPTSAPSLASAKPVSGNYVGDHVPIYTDLDLRHLRMTVPQLGVTLPRLLPTKLSKSPTPSQLDAFRAEVTRSHGTTLSDLTATLPETGTTLTTALTQLSGILDDIQSRIMPDTMSLTQANSTLYVFRPRKIGRARRKLTRDIDTIRNVARGRYDEPLSDLMDPSHLLSHQLLLGLPARYTARSALQHLKTYLKDMDKQYTSRQRQQARERMQHIFDRKPNVVYKLLLSNPDRPAAPPLCAVRHPKGGPPITFGPDIVQAVHDHFLLLSQPPLHTVPADGPLPFELPGAQDAYHLNGPAPDGDWITTALSDFETLKRCARLLASGKAPGPDGILNEVFKYSPDSLLQCVHAIFQRLSAGEGVPAALLRSVTVLLYKKDDPTDIANYRPIGLANTLMKFWTKLVAWVTTDYTEHFRILDRGQAGFRPGYHTHLHT
jgi:hypothetical protein